MTDLLREFAGACRREIASAEVIEDYPLGEKTTMKAGGNAALCVLPKDRDAFVSVLRLLRRHPVRYTLLVAVLLSHARNECRILRTCLY